MEKMSKKTDEAIASRLEAIALRLEAIPIRVEGVATRFLLLLGQRRK